MQDDKKLPDDLGTAHEVILVQSNTLVKQKVKIEELNKSLQEALAEIRFLRSGKKREIVQVEIPEEFKKTNQIGRNDRYSRIDPRVAQVHSPEARCR